MQPAHHDFDRTLTRTDFNFHDVHTYDGDDPDRFIDRHAADDTLLKFPAGTYDVSESHDLLGLEKFGIVGVGDDHRDVVFRPPKGESLRWLNSHGGRRHLYANFSLDLRDDNTSHIWTFFTNPETLIEDVEWIGRQGNDRKASIASQNCAVHCRDDVDGLVVLRRVHMRSGADQGGQAKGTAGVRVQPPSVGEVRFIDCEFAHLSSTPIRATQMRGCVRYVHCSFRDCNNSGMRISGGDHPRKDSFASKCLVEYTGQCNGPYSRPGDRVGNALCLNIDSSGTGQSGLRIESCDFVFSEADDGDLGDGIGMMRLPSYGDHSDFELVDCRFRLDEDRHYMLVQDNHPGGEFLVDECSFGGDVERTPGGAVFDVASGWDDSRIRKSDFDVGVEPVSAKSRIQMDNSPTGSSAKPIRRDEVGAGVLEWGSETEEEEDVEEEEDEEEKPDVDDEEDEEEEETAPTTSQRRYDISVDDEGVVYVGFGNSSKKIGRLVRE